MADEARFDNKAYTYLYIMLCVWSVLCVTHSAMVCLKGCMTFADKITCAVPVVSVPVVISPITAASQRPHAAGLQSFMPALLLRSMPRQSACLSQRLQQLSPTSST